MIGIADEVERCHLRAGNLNVATWCVEACRRHLGSVAARDEGNPNLPAPDWHAVLRRHDLEDLGLLVRRAVVPSRGQEASVVGCPETVHELRDELFRGQTAEALVLGWYDDVKPAVGGGDGAFGFEPAQGRSGRSHGNAHASRGLLCGEVVAAA